MAELARLFQLAPTKIKSHAEVVTETRGKIEHTAALKVSWCESFIVPFCAKKKFRQKCMMVIVEGGGSDRAPPRRERTNSLMGTKTETGEHQTDYCPASLLLFARGVKKAINVPHM